MSWTPEQLAGFDAARELEIAVRRADGTLRPWTPIWVVHAGADVYVRTWYRRDTGWLGLALNTRRARVRVAEVEVDARIEDVGVGPSGLRASVDAAYRDKYGGGSTRNPRAPRRRARACRTQTSSRPDNKCALGG
jgi:hypothetical protein